MTNDEIDKALSELGVRGAMIPLPHGGAKWDFAVAGVPAYVQTQANVDRMRIVAVIGNPKGRHSASLEELMAANFHTALDARYALSEGRLTAVFLHSLKALGSGQFLDALRQVSLAVRTAGAENASSPLTYGSAVSRTAVPEQYEDPKVGSQSSAPPGRYQPPPVVKHVVIPIVAAVAAAIATVLSNSLIGG